MKATDMRYVNRMVAHPDAIMPMPMDGIARPAAPPSRAGRVVRAIGAAALNQAHRLGGPTTAVKMLEAWGDKHLAEAVDWAAVEHGPYLKAMGISTVEAGGGLLPSALATEMIQLLRPASLVRKYATEVPMPAATARYPKVTGGAAVDYVGVEGVAPQITTLTVGQVVLTFKKMMAFVVASNPLLRYAGPNAVAADQVILADVVRGMGARENLAFLRDDGTLGRPKGMRWWAPAANVIASAGTAIANILTDLKALEAALDTAKVPRAGRVWYLPSASARNLATIQLAAGGPWAFRDEMVTEGTLSGYPFEVAFDLDGTGEVYLASGPDMMVGDALRIHVDLAQSATYLDAGTGTATNAWSRDESVFRVIAEHDFAMAHAESVAVLTGVNW